jgi:hypothetical protein
VVYAGVIAKNVTLFIIIIIIIIIINIKGWAFWPVPSPESYSWSGQRFFGLPTVIFPCGL